MNTRSQAGSPLQAVGLGASVGILWLLFLLVAAAAGPTVYWHATGSGLPSDVETLAAAPLSPAILYAGAWGQGVYRSVDHGATWQPASTGITLPLSVQGGLAVNPITPTVLYAGDYYGGGLYRSTNGGDSWSLVLPGAAVRAVAVHPLTPTIVLVGDREQGIYRSADGGDTWTPISATQGLTDLHVRALAFAPATPNVVYAGASQFLFRSTDAGQTWTVRGVLSSTVQALAVHPVTSSLVYAGTFNHGLSRSTDSGATWSQLTNGLPADAWVTSLAIHPLTPTILYAGTWDGQVYRTTDSGDSWEGLSYLGYVYSVLIHPTAPSVLYAATSNHGVFRGSTLDHLTIDPIASPQHVNRPFPITVTARDELGFPLTGPSQGELAALAEADPALAQTLAAGGFDGTAALTDTTGTIRPQEILFCDGVATGEVAIAVPVDSGVITATVPGGPTATSNPFDVTLFRVYLPVVRRSLLSR